jgi:universal stress protein E
MQAFTNILVDIDSNASVQPALEIGRRISQRCGAELRAVDIAAAVAARGSMIAAGGGTLAAEVLSSSLADALIDEVDRYGHDLVIRSQARDLAVRGDVAVQLFRRCPCPVWALGPAPLPLRPKIVAAVNASETDSLTLALNAKAIELALLLADLEGGMVSILHAWRPVAEKQLYVRSTPQEFDASIESAQERAARDLAALAGTFGTRLARARVELRRGLPEEAIPEFVVSEGVDIVIAGARGGGVWQRLFGSTAERLLEAAPCSLIVVKADASE